MGLTLSTKEEAIKLWRPYFNRVVVQPNGCHYIPDLKGRPKINYKKNGTTLTRVAMLAEDKMTIEEFNDTSVDVCHVCDDERCINIDDLFLGNAKINIRDAASKGRMLGNRREVTHCVHGHEYTKENTYLTRVGKKQCKICTRKRDACRQEYFAQYRLASREKLKSNIKT